MSKLFDWFYFCFYCLASAKGMKHERGAFGMNWTLGIYGAALVIMIISKLGIIQYPVLRVFIFFGLMIAIFYLLNHYVIEKRRYRTAIDRFTGTPKLVKFVFGLFALVLMLSNFLIMLVAFGFAAQ